MEQTGLNTLWFILICVLWIGYLTLEGFDFGVGMHLNSLPRNERERRATLNAIGPHWDGNEVWLLTAGGATFAAFPEWYATMFSGMYIALILILLCLIIRICALEWRKTIRTTTWRRTWDKLHTGSAWIVSILWGVAFGNLVQGMRIEVGQYDAEGAFHALPASDVTWQALADNQHYLTGGFWSLLTPFTILAGLVTMSLFASHGALFVAIKTSGELQERATKLARVWAPIATVLTAVWALWAFFAYSGSAWALLPLALAAVSLLLADLWIFKGQEIKAFAAHFAAIAMAVVFIFISMAPYTMKSSIDPAYSQTIAQAAASRPTQGVMTIATVIFVPIVLAYTIWAYSVFRKRIDPATIPVEPVGLEPKKVRQFELS
ncbi:cytochrome d ubiquinol oxidase subunit II [Neoactinobaculum massilliense]|uniref:cytochrome d ubiquinol oxidase subunit II n=1 Tax=Neoactinobaculum massilliense TaxID=2364794 RepID=UPI000F539E01|nr:cytochrome d ubiquinol oxidase subunit II [Neoactinobaculum massilliense]